MTKIGNYTIEKMIAEGGFARIYQAKHDLLEELACVKQTKIISEDYNELLRTEAKLLWKLGDHHSIPHIKDYLQLSDGSSAIIMSYIEGTTLEKMIDDKPKGKRMHPEDACWITERLLEAIFYAHYNGVIHSDIKPGNVIVEVGKHDIKLIDFGLSIYKPNAGTKPVGYTEAFAAPELINGKTPIPETDIYGAGIVMLYALGGDPFTKTLPADVHPKLKDYCNQMLRYNPIDRPNWEKKNLVEELSNVRLEVFGRRRTEYYSKTKKED
jgi:eukaryotic-like serine/threonine-protein kinase